MNDDSTPGGVRPPRKHPRRAQERTSALLPAEPGPAETPDGSTRVASAPVRRRRRHQSPEYTMLKGLLASLQSTGEAIEQLALHMERDNLPELPEVLSAQETNRKTIAVVLDRLEGKK